SARQARMRRSSVRRTPAPISGWRRRISSKMATGKGDLLGTVLLSVLSGHYRYAHITTLRCDAVNPRLLGMKKVVSEDAVHRGLAKIDEAAGLTWLQRHLDSCVWPLLTEPWVLDIDSTIQPLYG